MDGNCTNWFYLCLALLAVILAMLAMFFNYNLKLDKKGAKLEKTDQDHEHKIKKLEEKNGKEQRQIDELKEKIQELERKSTKYAK